MDFSSKAMDAAEDYNRRKAEICITRCNWWN